MSGWPPATVGRPVAVEASLRCRSERPAADRRRDFGNESREDGRGHGQFASEVRRRARQGQGVGNLAHARNGVKHNIACPAARFPTTAPLHCNTGPDVGHPAHSTSRAGPARGLTPENVLHYIASP
jgi:hypothetical protein